MDSRAGDGRRQSSFQGRPTPAITATRVAGTSRAVTVVRAREANSASAVTIAGVAPVEPAGGGTAAASEIG
jgi:hypothetical protein